MQIIADMSPENDHSYPSASFTGLLTKDYQRNFSMNKSMTRRLLSLLPLVLLTGCQNIHSLSDLSKATQETIDSLKPTPTVVPASQICREFKQNPLRTVNKYNGQRIEFTGPVHVVVGDDITGTGHQAYLSMGPVFASDNNHTYANQIAALNNGQKTTIIVKVTDVKDSIGSNQSCTIMSDLDGFK